MPNSVVNGQWQISPFADKLPSGKLAVGTIMPLQCSDGFTSSVSNPFVTCDNVMGSGQWVGPGENAHCVSKTAQRDCKGHPFAEGGKGNYVFDNCEKCVLPKDKCKTDCAGDWGGNTTNDDCGVCGGDDHRGCAAGGR